MVEEMVEKKEEICSNETHKKCNVSYSLSDEIYNVFVDMYYSSIRLNRIQKEEERIETDEKLINVVSGMDETKVVNIEDKTMMAQVEEEKKKIEIVQRIIISF
ncbi:hypothetical protein Hanom_Chr01g00058781 [Helianthus anomalus]